MSLPIRSGFIVTGFALASLIQGCQNQPYVYDMSDSPASDPNFDTPPAQVYADPPHVTPQPAPAEAPRAIPRTVQQMPANTYTIKRGDTLWSIAKQTYGNGQRWRDIVSANPSLNPAKLSVGQRIVLP